MALAVDKWAYLNVNVADLVFTKAGQNYTVPVSSNTVDSFGNVDVFGDPTINGAGDVIDEIKDGWNGFWGDVSDFWGSMMKVLAWVGIGVAVLVVLFIVLRFIKPKDKVELVLPDGTNPKRRKRRK